MLTLEALGIRNYDIFFSSSNSTPSPTRIRIRLEYCKRRVARDVYISEEARYYLKQFLDHKYKNERHPREFHEDDLVFTVYQKVK